MTELNTKEMKSDVLLKDMQNVVIASSSGVDSSLLLKKAIDILGVNYVKPIVVKSELPRNGEFELALKLGRSLGVKVLEAEMSELQDASIVKNTPEGWYYSKRLMHSQLENIKNKLEFDYVLDGMIMSDLDDLRPGLKTRDNSGVRSVLQGAKLYKSEVRELSHQHDLPVWNKPALCSLASSVPYGEELSFTKVNKVSKAEKFILSLGINHARVRYHHNITCTEVVEDQLNNLLKLRDSIILYLKGLGFDYITMGLEGYRTGSINEAIDAKSTSFK